MGGDQGGLPKLRLRLTSDERQIIFGWANIDPSNPDFEGCYDVGIDYNDLSIDVYCDQRGKAQPVLRFPKLPLERIRRQNPDFFRAMMLGTPIEISGENFENSDGARLYVPDLSNNLYPIWACENFRLIPGIDPAFMDIECLVIPDVEDGGSSTMVRGIRGDERAESVPRVRELSRSIVVPEGETNPFYIFRLMLMSADDARWAVYEEQIVAESTRIFRSERTHLASSGGGQDYIPPKGKSSDVRRELQDFYGAIDTSFEYYRQYRSRDWKDLPPEYEVARAHFAEMHRMFDVTPAFEPTDPLISERRRIFLASRFVLSYVAEFQGAAENISVKYYEDVDHGRQFSFTEIAEFIIQMGEGIHELNPTTHYLFFPNVDGQPVRERLTKLLAKIMEAQAHLRGTQIISDSIAAQKTPEDMAKLIARKRERLREVRDELISLRGKLDMHKKRMGRALKDAEAFQASGETTKAVEARRRADRLSSEKVRPLRNEIRDLVLEERSLQTEVEGFDIEEYRQLYAAMEEMWGAGQKVEKVVGTNGRKQKRIEFVATPGLTKRVEDDFYGRPHTVNYYGTNIAVSPPAERVDLNNYGSVVSGALRARNYESTDNVLKTVLTLEQVLPRGDDEAERKRRDRFLHVAESVGIAWAREERGKDRNLLARELFFGHLLRGIYIRVKMVDPTGTMETICRKMVERLEEWRLTIHGVETTDELRCFLVAFCFDKLKRMKPDDMQTITTLDDECHSWWSLLREEYLKMFSIDEIGAATSSFVGQPLVPVLSQLAILAGKREDEYFRYSLGVPNGAVWERIKQLTGYGDISLGRDYITFMARTIDSDEEMVELSKYLRELMETGTDPEKAFARRLINAIYYRDLSDDPLALLVRPSEISLARRVGQLPPEPPEAETKVVYVEKGTAPKREPDWTDDYYWWTMIMAGVLELAVGGTAFALNKTSSPYMIDHTPDWLAGSDLGLGTVTFTLTFSFGSPDDRSDEFNLGMGSSFLAFALARAAHAALNFKKRPPLPTPIEGPFSTPGAGGWPQD